MKNTSPYIYRTYENVTAHLVCEPLDIGDGFRAYEVKDCRVEYVIDRETGEIAQKRLIGHFHHSISYIECEFSFTIEKSVYYSDHYLMYFNMFPAGTEVTHHYVDYDTSEDKQHIVHDSDFQFSLCKGDDAVLVYSED